MSDTLKDKIAEYLFNGEATMARLNLAEEAVDFIFGSMPELREHQDFTLTPLQEEDLNQRLVLCAAEFLVSEGVSVESLRSAEIYSRRRQCREAGRLCRGKGLGIEDVPYESGTDEHKWWIEGYEEDESNAD